MLSQCGLAELSLVCMGQLVNCLNSIEASYREEIKDPWTFVVWAPMALALIGLYFKT